MKNAKLTENLKNKRFYCRIKALFAKCHKNAVYNSLTYKNIILEVFIKRLKKRAGKLLIVQNNKNNLRIIKI